MLETYEKCDKTSVLKSSARKFTYVCLYPRTDNITNLYPWSVFRASYVTGSEDNTTATYYISPNAYVPYFPLSVQCHLEVRVSSGEQATLGDAEHPIMGMPRKVNRTKSNTKL